MTATDTRHGANQNPRPSTLRRNSHNDTGMKTGGGGGAVRSPSRLVSAIAPAYQTDKVLCRPASEVGPSAAAVRQENKKQAWTGQWGGGGAGEADRSKQQRTPGPAQTPPRRRRRTPCAASHLATHDLRGHRRVILRVRAFVVPERRTTRTEAGRGFDRKRLRPVVTLVTLGSRNVTDLERGYARPAPSWPSTRLIARSTQGDDSRGIQRRDRREERKILCTSASLES